MGFVRRALLLSIGLLARQAGAVQAKAPHIVMVVIDDLGWGDLSYQSEDMKKSAPHIDAMASEGVKLERMYASPECTPTRAMLLTGQHITALGMQDSVIQGTEPRGVPLDAELLPQMLQKRNYRTYAVGKWHLGFHQPQYTPTARGFDRFYGILTGGGNHYSHVTTEAFTTRGGNATKARGGGTTHALVGWNLWEDDAPVTTQPPETLHTTALYTGIALKYVAEHAASSGDVPFYMYLAYQAVHGPMQADAAFTNGQVDNGCAATARMGPGADPDVAWHSRVKLCGMVSMVDMGLGRLRAGLEEQELWEDTALFFLSDNGGVKRHGSVNLPFRGEKGVYFEGGVRVPAFIAGGYTARALAASGGRTPGAYTSTLAHVADLAVTALALAGTPASELAALTTASSSDDDGTGALYGRDLWAALTTEGASSPREEVLVNRNSDLWGGGGALVRGRYKLLVENSVGDAVLYRAGQAYLQTQDYTVSDLSQALQERREEVFPQPNFFLFDLEANPSEDDSGSCAASGGGVDAAASFASAPPAACANLWSSEDAEVAVVREELLASWAAHGEALAPSNELFADDGPLAHPDWFGGTWSPWRDEAGVPYSTYGMLNGDAERGHSRRQR